MTPHEIAAAIVRSATTGNIASIADIRIIEGAVKQAWATVQATKAAAFYRGQSVTFKTRDGRVIAGTVKSANVKTVTVTDCKWADPATPAHLYCGEEWRISPQILTPAAK